MVINHHISNVMVPIGLRAAFHGLIGLESSFEAFPNNHGLFYAMSKNQPSEPTVRGLLKLSQIDSQMTPKWSRIP